VVRASALVGLLSEVLPMNMPLYLSQNKLLMWPALPRCPRATGRFASRPTCDWGSSLLTGRDWIQSASNL